MIIYCDQLNWKSVFMILRLLTKKHAIKEIILLERLPSSVVSTWAEGYFRNMGISVSEKMFFSGKMFWEDGESLMSRSLKVATAKAFEEAEVLLKQSAVLKEINEQYPCKTIHKVLARSLYGQVGRIITHVHLINFFHKDDKKDVLLIMGAHRGFHDMQWPCEDHVQLKFYTPWMWEQPRRGYYAHTKQENLKRTGVGSIACAINFVLRNMFDKASQGEIPVPNDQQKAILMLQDDEIDIDPSYRGQPHWRHACSEAQKKRIVIIEDSYYSSVNQVLDRQALAKENIYLLKNTGVFLRKALGIKSSTSVQLKSIMLRLLGLAFSGKPIEKFILFDMNVVILKSFLLVPIVKEYHVDAFISAENYKPDAEAIRLIADQEGITTFSYQYSNQGFLPPAMVNTAHVMMTFSPLFEQPLTRQVPRPKTLVQVGYPYLSAVPFLKQRSKELRDHLLKTGASFVLCYFDENSTKDKFGFCSVAEQEQELRLLYDFLLADPSIALIIKTQFMRNLPEYFKDIEALRQKALSSGRYVELKKGILRNRVLPAEAALAADMVIGHHTGATATLEAALVGKRTILINNCGRRNMQDAIYERSRIVYNQLEDIIEDIKKFRKGEAMLTNMGDWSKITHEFDSFCDDNVAYRFVDALARRS